MPRAREPRWGYQRIAGELGGLGVPLSATTVRKLLREAGLRVERSWDGRVGPVAPKSRAGRRRVALSKPLRHYLIAHRLLSAAGEDELVLGRGKEHALSPEALVRRARKAWKGRGLSPIGLHECRHTYAAFMIAAGVNAKALSTYMGHASITVTLDRYGHLMQGNEREAAGMLAAYLQREIARA